MKLRKKILFCTYPSIYSDLVLQCLLNSAEIDLVGVVYSTRTANIHDSFLQGAFRHLRRSGFAYSFYQWLVTDGYAIAKSFLGRSSIEGRLLQQGIPVHKTSDINAIASEAFVSAVAADYLLCAHFNQLLKPMLLSIPTRGCVNIHPSLLPDYKGVDPAFYMLLEQAQQIGVSVHFQSEQFDEGDLLVQRSLEMVSSESLLSLNSRLFVAGAEAFISLMSEDALFPVRQDSGGRYDSWPTSNQVARLRKKALLWRFNEWRKYVCMSF